MAQDFPGATEDMQHALNLDGDVDRIRAFYEDWAATYDADVSPDYGSPQMAVDMIRQTAERYGRPQLLDPSLHILDAGCGTGLVGQALHDAGWRNLHGVDLSPEMVARAAERGVYRSLSAGFDLTQDVGPEHADIAQLVTIIGVFTSGHVPPSALRQAVRLVAPGGILVTSTRAAYLESTDYAAVSSDLETEGQLRLLHRVDGAPYTMDSVGSYWSYLRLA